MQISLSSSILELSLIAAAHVRLLLTVVPHSILVSISALLCFPKFNFCPH